MAHPTPATTVARGGRLAGIALALTLAAVGAPAGAQEPASPAPAAPRFARPTLRALAGIAVGTPFVEDGNGTTVRPGVAPLLGVEVASRVGERTAVTLALRGARPGAMVDFDAAGSDDVDGGTVTTVDVVAGVEYAVHRRVTARGGLGLLYLEGPAELAPFRFNNGSSIHPLLDVGADVKLAHDLPLALALSWQGYRYGAATAADPIEEAGVVQRLVVGVRYGR